MPRSVQSATIALMALTAIAAPILIALLGLVLLR